MSMLVLHRHYAVIVFLSWKFYGLMKDAVVYRASG